MLAQLYCQVSDALSLDFSFFINCLENKYCQVSEKLSLDIYFCNLFKHNTIVKLVISSA